MREPGVQLAPPIERAAQEIADDDPQYAKNKIHTRNGMMERNDGNI
jgi:hypothetical protein